MVIPNRKKEDKLNAGGQLFYSYVMKKVAKMPEKIKQSHTTVDQQTACKALVYWSKYTNTGGAYRINVKYIFKTSL